MKQSRLDHRRKLEALEQKVYLAVKKVIDASDPESLLKLGAPKDEYDSTSHIVAQAIVREGGSGLNRTELAYIVALTFHIEFNQWTHPVHIFGTYFDIADKLLPALPKIKR
jgi:hypothetical protein